MVRYDESILRYMRSDMEKIASPMRMTTLAALLVLIVVPPFLSGVGRAGWGEALIFLCAGILFFSASFAPGRESGASLLERAGDTKLWWMFFLLALGLGIFFSVDRAVSFDAVMMFTAYAAIFFSVRKLDVTALEVRVVAKVLVGTAAVLSLVGIAQYLGADITRIGSLFYWPNAFAGWLLLLLPAALFFFLTEKRPGSVAVLGLVLGIIGATFVLTESRAAYASLLVALPLVFLSVRSLWRPALVLRTFGIALLIALLASVIFSLKVGRVSIPYLTKYSVGEGTADLSVVGRTAYWKGAFAMFRDKPIVGWGLGTFGVVYPHYQKGPLLYAKYAHNAYLEMLAEAGIVGALPFFVLIATVLLGGAQLLRRSFTSQKDASAIFLVLFAGVLASLLHNAFDIDWHFSSIAALFWVCVAMCTVIPYTEATSNLRKSKL